MDSSVEKGKDGQSAWTGRVRGSVRVTAETENKVKVAETRPCSAPVGEKEAVKLVSGNNSYEMHPWACPGQLWLGRWTLILSKPKIFKQGSQCGLIF